MAVVSRHRRPSSAIFDLGFRNPGFWTRNNNLISNPEPETDQVVPSPVIKLKVPKLPKRIYASNIKILRSDKRYEKTGSNINKIPLSRRVRLKKEVFAYGGRGVALVSEAGEIGATASPDPQRGLISKKYDLTQHLVISECQSY